MFLCHFHASGYLAEEYNHKPQKENWYTGAKLLMHEQHGVAFEVVAIATRSFIEHEFFKRKTYFSKPS